MTKLAISGNFVGKCLNFNVETISFDNQPANLARILCVHQSAVMSEVLSSGAVHMLTIADGRVQVRGIPLVMSRSRDSLQPHLQPALLPLST